MKNIENYLDVCIITYNRASYLEATIKKFLGTPLKNCNIYVIDNCSTDNTRSVVEKYGDTIKYHKNRFNIGLGANIMRALEFGEKPYIWIIGDDDDYDFEHIDDLISVFDEGKIDLIHVGAHTDMPWTFGGQTINTRTAVEQGYHFFKYSSFIGCDIVKRKAAEEYAIKGYDNIVNTYPHMPFMLSFFEENKPIYISKNRIAKAVLGNQSYNSESLMKWWGNTSKLLNKTEDQKKCFFEQYNNPQKIKWLLLLKYRHKNKKISDETFRSIMQFHSASEKIIAGALYPLYFIKYSLIKSSESNE